MLKQILSGDLGLKSEIIIGVIVLAVVYLITTAIRRHGKKYPPGPYGLPLFGYAPFLTEKPYLKFIEISKQYGDIFSISMGTERWVILNSADAIKEALLKPEFLNRPPYGPLTPFKKESPFFTSPIHVWQEQRKFVVQSMKDLGLGKSKIEDHVKDEINAFIEVVKSHGGKPMDLKEPLAPSMSNNITALVFGVRHDYDHPDRKLLDKNAEDINKHIQELGFLHLFPWMKHLYFSKDSKYQIVANGFKSSHKLFRKMIEEHKKTLDPENIRDYVDRYLIEMKSRKDKDPKTTFNENTLADSASDMFGAGSETVFTSVLWCVYIMAAYPQLQKKVQKEIMDVIGPDRMAELLDQKSMPFTHATILEVLRFITIAPLNFLHYTTVDATLKDYFIPRNTAILANFWAVHHDTRYWEDPNSFKPERFISEDGKSVVKPPNYMPFSMGKRSCPGETMAYMEIFLYFATILQRFNAAFPEGYKPTFNSHFALSLRPEDFKIRFLSRNQS
ncbi:cytochrome P450 2J6-like [Parasteatoda tepidariorum]|uniref:cytochrome P450 2J6-like n=1 Tax=Parasteatoda tepidariorum TaxID=114398 RepID=UPI00077FA9FA|nr:cytochrome P450 2J6-like [Parasteatoda tepidariorum]